MNKIIIATACHSYTYVPTLHSLGHIYYVIPLHMQQWKSYTRPAARGAKENVWRCEEEAYSEDHCSKGQRWRKSCDNSIHNILKARSI